MSNTVSSRNILRTEQAFGSFLDRLQTAHEVADESPTAQWGKREIQRKFNQAYEEGQLVGYSAGYARGEAKGLEVGLATGASQAARGYDEAHREQFEATASALENLVSTAKTEIDQWFEEAEKRLAILAVEIARRALVQELAMHEDAILDIARNVIAEATDSTHIRLRVNPSRVGHLEGRRHELIEALSHIRDIEIVSDSSIHAGCILESDSGVIDARIEHYLHRLALEALGGAA